MSAVHIFLRLCARLISFGRCGEMLNVSKIQRYLGSSISKISNKHSVAIQVLYINIYTDKVKKRFMKSQEA